MGDSVGERADATNAHTAFIQSIDPADKLQAATPRALLIMNNDFDYDQPKLYSIYAYRELRPPMPAQPDKLQLSIYPAAHTVTPEMERRPWRGFSDNCSRSLLPPSLLSFYPPPLLPSLSPSPSPPSNDFLTASYG